MMKPFNPLNIMEEEEDAIRAVSLDTEQYEACPYCGKNLYIGSHANCGQHNTD